MKSYFLCLLIAAACLYAGASEAADYEPQVFFGKPEFLRSAVSGCDATNTSATLTPDNRGLTLIFDRMSAEAGNGTGTARAHKRCRMRIPASIPEGYQIVLTKQDFRGSNLLPKGGTSILDIQEKFEHSRWSSGVYKRFNGPIDYEPYTLENYVINDVRSPCGGNTHLLFHADLSISVPNKTSDSSLTSLDTIDFTGKASFRYKVIKCAK